MTLRNCFELAMGMVFPVLLTLVLLLLKEKYQTRFGKYKILAGICFGIAAIFGTEIGIVSTGGSLINLRDAAVICAGLFFGLPGGITAGLIGSIERMMAAYIWGSAGQFTAVACALATFLSGTVSGIFRNTLFENKTPSLAFGVIMGVITETCHTGMVILFGLSDFEMALSAVKANLLPLIICNTGSIVLSILAVKLIISDNFKRDNVLNKE